MKILSSGLLLAALLAAGEVEAASRPDLTGQVVQKDGAVLTNATVYIYTATPRTGEAYLCPSCYPDCRKSVPTDASGKFTIPSLAPELLFRVLVVASGYEAKFESKVDPLAGPLKVELQANQTESDSTLPRFTGRVIGPDGKAVAGAVLDVGGVSLTSSGTWGGQGKYTEVVAVTDKNGRFVLRGKSAELLTVHAILEARGMAKRWADLKAGRDYLLRMDEGVTVTGRVVQGGKPQANIIVGMATEERLAGVYLHNFEDVTDDEGRFTLFNVPASNRFNLYSNMDSKNNQGTLPMRLVATGAAESKVALGDLEIGRANRLRGRVTLSDGKVLPADTRLVLSREDASDYIETKLDAEGGFDLTGVPSESVSITVQVPGYKFSKRNVSLDWLNGGILGKINGDILDLHIELEPGKWRYNGEEGTGPEGENQPRGKPLRGVK